MSLVQGNSSNKANVKWPGISKLNNFEFSSDGVRVWRAYQVGEGKFSLGQNLKVLFILSIYLSH